MSTFTWIPDAGLRGSSKPTVLVAKFGDGYEQRIPDGINNNPKTYEPSFSLLTLATFSDIAAFLDAHKGASAFDWTPPGGTAGRYICEQWSDTSDQVTYNISATFRQVFGI